MSGEPAGTEYLPLPMAAAVAYCRIVEHDEREPACEGLLDVVASALGIWIPIYGSRSPGAPRTRLSDDEVARGKFSNGATRLRFSDAAAPIDNLAILHCDLEAAIRRLKHAGVRFSTPMIEPAPRRVPRVYPRI